MPGEGRGPGDARGRPRRGLCFPSTGGAPAGRTPPADLPAALPLPPSPPATCARWSRGPRATCGTRAWCCTPWAGALESGEGRAEGRLREDPVGPLRGVPCPPLAGPREPPAKLATHPPGTPPPSNPGPPPKVPRGLRPAGDVPRGRRPRRRRRDRGARRDRAHRGGVRRAAAAAAAAAAARGQLRLRVAGCNTCHAVSHVSCLMSNQVLPAQSAPSTAPVAPI
jgi:hypothetical protein